MPYIQVKLACQDLSVSAARIATPRNSTHTPPFSAIVTLRRLGGRMSVVSTSAAVPRPAAEGSDLEIMFGGQWEPQEIEKVFRLAASALRIANKQLKAAK